MKRAGATFCLLLVVIAFGPTAEARRRRADLYSLYEVTRNARFVVQGTVTEVDTPRQVIELRVDKLWHGGGTEGPQKTGDLVRYEVRGSLDAYRVGREVLEFLDPNLPYGTQDPATIMAPWKPRSVRNRVVLSDPESAAYAAFALSWLEITQGDRGANWSPAAQAHLISALGSADDRVRKAAGESLHDLLTLAGRSGRIPRELLQPSEAEAIGRVLQDADFEAGPSLMKLAVTLNEPSLARGMVHGALYLPQAGVDATEAVGQALTLAPEAANRAIRTEYAEAATDGYREQLISVMAALGGSHGAAFLRERVADETNPYLRREALLAYFCLQKSDLWDDVVEIYGGEPPERKSELLGRLARCHPEQEGLAPLLTRELGSDSEPVRRTAAIEAARLEMDEALPELQKVVDACRTNANPDLSCLLVLGALRELGSPEAIEVLEQVATDEEATDGFRQDAQSFLEDLRRLP